MNKEQDKIIQNILERLGKIELKVFPLYGETFKPSPAKQKTMTEMLRGKDLTGQQKVSFIVGYHEKILGKKSANITDIKDGWKQAKFNNSYVPMFLARAIKEGLVNDYDKNGEYSLTQSGESFFESKFNQTNEQN